MVEIKPFDLQNVAVHYKWNNDEELSYYDSDYPHKFESFDTFLKRVKSVVDERNRTARLFEIHLSGDGKLIGIVDIHSIDGYNRRCFVNCTIGDREYMEKGYDAEALKTVLQYCFSELNMHKVGAVAFDFNTYWIEQVQSLGFKKEGELREHVLKKGEFKNKLLFGLLSSEYRENLEEVSSSLSAVR